MISQYVVNGVALGGIALMALGAFYLANGTFGRSGKRMLRVLLVAIVVTVYKEFVDLYFLASNPGPKTIRLGPLAFGPYPTQLFGLSPLAIDLLGGLLIFLSIFGLAYGATIVVDDQAIIAAQIADKKILSSVVKFWPLALMLYLVVGAIVYTLILSRYNKISFGSSLLQAEGTGATYLILGAGIYFTKGMTDRGLQISGLCLTIIGGAAQAVPYILPFFNIKLV